MTIQERQLWQEVLEDTFRLFGRDGQVTIEDGDKSDEFRIKHSAFTHSFIGFFPESHEVFTLQLADHPIRDEDGSFLRTFKEAFVFDAELKAPIIHFIKKDMESQKIMIKGTKQFKAGDVFYYNTCRHCTGKQGLIDSPVFESELFDLSEVIANFK